MNEKLTRFCSILLILFPWAIVFSSAATQTFTALIAIGFMVHSATTRNWQWLEAPWVRRMLIMWIYMMARGVIVDHPVAALGRTLPFVRYFAFSAAIAYWLMKDERLRKHFLLSLQIMLLFVMADGFLQWYTCKDILGYVCLPEPSTGRSRLTGPFGREKLILGIVLAWLGLPVAVYGLLTEQGKWHSPRKLIQGFAFFLALLLIIAFSVERMALILAVFGTGFILLLLPLRRRLFLMASGGGAALFVATMFFVPSIFDGHVKSTLNILSHWEESAYGKLLASDLKLAAVQPILGIGSNQFRTACPALYPNESTEFIKTVCNLHPHNIYFEWQIENGIIGLTLFLVFIVLISREWVRARKQAPFHPLLMGWMAAFLIRIWPVGSTTGFFSSWGGPPFWLAVGMLLAYTTLLQNAKTRP